jgi:hypothetical protein
VDNRISQLHASDDEAELDAEEQQDREPNRAPAPPLSPKLLRSRPPKPRSAPLPTRASDLLGGQRPNKLMVGKVRVAARRRGK